MNKIGMLLDRLHAAELDLADEFAKVGERHATDQDVWHVCHQLAKQCNDRAAEIRAISERFDKPLGEPSSSDLWDSMLATVRRTAADAMGRRPEPGLLLLRDLRRLYSAAHDVDAYWIMLGQTAHAVRDRDLLGRVDGMHRQLLTQVKWLKTRIKESTAQIVVAG